MINTAAGVSLREGRTAVVPLLWFKITHFFTKSQQVYVTDGEKSSGLLSCQAEAGTSLVLQWGLCHRGSSCKEKKKKIKGSRSG